MDKILKILAFALAISSPVSHALSGSPAETQGIYYIIGGGEALREPLNVGATPKFGLANSLRGATSCDVWDGLHLDGEVLEMMVRDHVEEQARNFATQLIENIQSYATGALALAVQRAMPEMYDFAMQVDSQLSGKIEIAKVSCEQAMENIDNGISPFDNWITASGGFSWANSLNTGATEGGINILEAQENASNEKGEIPVPWVNGELRGGAGVDPIMIVNDATLVGYAAQAASAATTEDGTAAEQTIAFAQFGAVGSSVDRNQALGRYWATSGAAAEWATNVLGETTISYCADCEEAGFQSGKGLQWAAHEEKQTVVESWNTLYATADPINQPIAALQGLSSTRVQITRDVLVSLSYLNPQDRAMFVNRLASDVATYRTIEKAMAMRRILQSALQEPGIKTHEAGTDEIEERIAELEGGIQEMIYEIEIGSKLVSAVPTALFAYDEAKKAAAMRLGNGPKPAPIQQTILTPQGPINR